MIINVFQMNLRYFTQVHELKIVKISVTVKLMIVGEEPILPRDDPPNWLSNTK